MYITIHCGGMPFNGETIKEQSLGGSESAAFYMAQELKNEGHKVTLFTHIDKPSETDGVRYLPTGPITEACPLGTDFHHYSTNTPVDVMIIQRHPLAFQYPWASKVNLWWLHDLATKSTEAMAQMHAYNFHGILCVSEWHKQQICDTWNVDPEFVMPIQNGVDLSLYSDEPEYLICKNLGTTSEIEEGVVVTDPKCDEQVKLIYSSRPERGLENLVAPKGIMAQLLETNPEYHLYVCNYANTTERMAGYYTWLYEQCDKLPNVTILGNLTKQELADVQRQCDACIYPTAFEETSCITAMECAAADLPLISSKVGALPETTKLTNVTLFSLLPKDEDYRGMEIRIDGKADVDKFVNYMQHGFQNDTRINSISSHFDWAVSAAMLLGHVDNIFGKKSNTALAKHYLHNSDIYALKDLMVAYEPNEIAYGIVDEINDCYDFINGKWAEHYAAYYEYEKGRGVNYGPENLTGQPRFEFVSDLVSTLPEGSVVLDYGCAHGHFTVNLAKRFPKISFRGVDITPSNVEKAELWASDEKLTNVEFFVGSVRDGELQATKDGRYAADHDSLDLIITAEVLEHLESPADCIDALAPYLKGEGQFCVTTPYGPWEAEGYEQHWPWRAHVHHLEREDIFDLFGMHKGLDVLVAPAGAGKFGKPMGSYIYTFGKPAEPSGAIDYERKHRLQMPRETVSLCMIVKDASLDIGRCLDSVRECVDEIIIGLDEGTTDRTKEVIDRLGLHIPVTIFDMESPTKSGFDAARNKTLEKASGDWILWMDSDEVMHNPLVLHKYLRLNQFKGYSIPQHHFSMQPMGVIKTDMPVRLFRNNEDIKFFGVVHEHPETEINKGVGRAINIIDVEIAHYGYENEEVRRKRFQRNIGLMIRDRETYPERQLGKFLWLRDLSQMCGFELEQNGMNMTAEMLSRAERGMEIFEELLHKDTIRMAVEGLEFYSRLSGLIGGGFDFNSEIESQRVQGHFHSVDHLKKLTELVINEKVEKHEPQKYV